MEEILTDEERKGSIGTFFKLDVVHHPRQSTIVEGDRELIGKGQGCFANNINEDLRQPITMVVRFSSTDFLEPMSMKKRKEHSSLRNEDLCYKRFMPNVAIWC